jgi:hypothetical protein
VDPGKKQAQCSLIGFRVFADRKQAGELWYMKWYETDGNELFVFGDIICY